VAFHFSFARTKEKRKQKENSPAGSSEAKICTFFLKKKNSLSAQTAFSS